jgi:hypothetical protein
LLRLKNGRADDDRVSQVAPSVDGNDLIQRFRHQAFGIALNEFVVRWR